MTQQFVEQLKSRWQFVLAATVFISALSFSVSALIPPKFESAVSMIVIQKQPDDKIDAFSAAKSAEYLSDILSKVVYTSSFFDDVQRSQFSVRRDFPADPEERTRAWEKTVNIRTMGSTGIVEVTVLDRSREFSEGMARAIAWNFSENGARYHGGGDKVEVKLIDGPVTPNRPTWPSVWLNAISGAFAGLIGSAGYIFFFPQSRVIFYRHEEE